jgi:hypothetical protein
LVVFIDLRESMAEKDGVSSRGAAGKGGVEKALLWRRSRLRSWLDG